MAKENRGNIIITTDKYWPGSCILCPAMLSLHSIVPGVLRVCG